MCRTENFKNQLNKGKRRKNKASLWNKTNKELHTHAHAEKKVERIVKTMSVLQVLLYHIFLSNKFMAKLLVTHARLHHSKFDTKIVLSINESQWGHFMLSIFL